ncbi:MAG: hypothetical protein RJA24_493, partial [Pseudomonadota bacterium]
MMRCQYKAVLASIGFFPLAMKTNRLKREPTRELSTALYCWTYLPIKRTRQQLNKTQSLQ